MPLDAAPAILVIGSAIGLAGGSAWAIFRRLRPRPGLTGRTALQRAASYAALALTLAVAVRTGLPGITILIGVL